MKAIETIKNFFGLIKIPFTKSTGVNIPIQRYY